MDLKTQAKLQEQALNLLGRRFDRQIQLMATKQLPLTDADCAQLEFYVNASKHQHDNTIYWANSVIFPAVTDRKTIKIR